MKLLCSRGDSSFTLRLYVKTCVSTSQQVAAVCVGENLGDSLGNELGSCGCKLDMFE